LRKFIESWGIYFIFIIGVILVITPLLARLSADSPLMPGSESYFNLRMANAISENPIMKEDSLQERPYNFNLYHYLLAFALKFVSEQELVIFSILPSLLSVILLYFTFLKFGFSIEKSLLVIMVYIFSPIFTFVSTTLTPHTLSMFLLALSLYLYSFEGNYGRTFWYFVPASLLVITDFSVFLVFILAFFIYSMYVSGNFKEPLWLLGVGAFIGVLFNVLFNYVPLLKLSENFSLVNYITDFGAMMGYSFFVLLLAFVTIVLFWNRGFKTNLAHLFVIALLIFSMLSPGARIVVNIILVIYAGIALDFFIRRKWIVDILRDLTILILISSLLFSSISYGNRITTMEPTQSTVDALEMIKQDRRQGKVLSLPENGFIIEYFAQKSTYIDEMSYHYEGYDEKLSVAAQIFNSKSPTKTKELLSQNNITYVYLDPKMKSDKYGIFLVLKVSENFINLGEFEGRESWLYLNI